MKTLRGRLEPRRAPNRAEALATAAPAGRRVRVAVTVRTSGAVPAVILLDDHASADDKRRALAHELGHLVMDRACAAPCGPHETETRADRFADEFLMGRDAPEWPSWGFGPSALGDFLRQMQRDRWTASDCAAATKTDPAELSLVFGRHWPFARPRPALRIVSDARGR